MPDLRGLLLAFYLISGGATLAAEGAPPTDSPPAAAPAPEAPVDPIVARGKYLAAAGDCISCHTRPGGAPFTGGVGFETPFGSIYSSNITPDNETGIGKWTAADLRKAMHEGIAPGGKHLFPAFPYTAFTKVTDQDVDAIYAYLRTLKAERYQPPANGLLFTMRWPMMFWNALFFDQGRYKADTSKSAEWNTGAYLVEGLGHCSACHTPRNIFQAEVAARAYAGGVIMDHVAEGKSRRWSAVNLTSAKTGLASWPVEELKSYLKTGASAVAGTFGPMNDVIVNGTSQLTDADVQAMAVYLKALPAREQEGQPVSAAEAQAGKAIYDKRCSECHQAAGEGGLFSAPPLAGSAIVQTADPASLINVILYGPQIPKGVDFGSWETMKFYGDVLSDADVAALSNYLRGSWGNTAPAVTAAQAAAQR